MKHLFKILHNTLFVIISIKLLILTTNILESTKINNFAVTKMPKFKSTKKG